MTTTYRIDATSGNPVAIPNWVHPRIRAWAEQNNITPWSHQAQVWDAWHDGFDACVTTPTGSGKTLAFTIPILETLINSQDTHILAIFPLKALANDQINTMRQLLAQHEMAHLVGVIDGDTPHAERVHLLATRRVIVTNPYILHANMGKDIWRAWLKTLTLTICDEIHTYSGVFGSEMAWVFRRLWRLAGRGLWNQSGRVITASATLADPLGHILDLMDRDGVVLVDRSGAATPARTWLVAPFSPDNLIASIEQQIRANAQTLVYANTRSSVEQIARQLSVAFPETVIKAYRSGYPQPIREGIERELREGTLRVVVSTSALATGIDIGGLDTVVMADLPPDASILKQVAGRAGRRGQGATIIVLPNPNTPVGALLLNRGGIQQLLNRTAAASAQLHNPVILDRQLLLMAAELPLLPTNAPVMADLPIRRALRRLEAENKIVLKSDGFAPTHRIAPHSLMIQADGSIPLILDDEIIDRLSKERATTQYAPQHLVTYRGQSYRCFWTKQSATASMSESFRVELRHLTTEESATIMHTQPSIHRTVTYQRSIATENSAFAVITGDVLVTARVEKLITTYATGERASKTYSRPLLASYKTRGLSIQLASPVDHGFVHSLLLEAEDRLGVSSSEVAEYHTANQITFYDRDGERGAVDIISDHIDSLIASARQRIISCGCARGCLNCVVVMHCKDDVSKDLAPHAVYSLADRDHVVLQPVPKDDEPDRAGPTLRTRNG